jgi:3-oxoacyl-[acyl-carrier protein] reductase
MSSLAGRSIVITGATGGLGRALAEVCAREGARVAVAYRRDGDAAWELCADLEARHGTAAFAVAMDVTSSASIDRAVAVCMERTGQIDGFVNNAAIVRPGLLVTASDEQIREQLDTDLLGPILCARSVLPHMVRRRAGVLLNISSVAAVAPVRGQAVYAAAKGGLEALTRALAAEYTRKGVRVLCLRPGPIDTPMLAPTAELVGDAVHARAALQRAAQPSEVAELAAFLLSDRASYVAGSCVAIDGGWGLA